MKSHTFQYFYGEDPLPHAVRSNVEIESNSIPRLAHGIAKLERGLNGLLNIDAFDITVSDTLSRAITARNKVRINLQLAKECKIAMQIVLDDLNKNKGKTFEGRASTVYGRMRNRAKVYVREGNRQLTLYNMLCRRAIRELQEEEEGEEN